MLSLVLFCFAGDDSAWNLDRNTANPLETVEWERNKITDWNDQG